jgi:NADH-quinone oxidoreductase subunit L
MLLVVSEAASLLGVPFGWLLARQGRAQAAAPQRRTRVHSRFLQSGWGFDWVYDRVFVRPFVWLARINARDVVDRLIDGIGWAFTFVSKGLRQTQNGKVRWYAAGLAMGAVLIVAAVVLL